MLQNSCYKCCVCSNCNIAGESGTVVHVNSIEKGVDLTIYILQNHLTKNNIFFILQTTSPIRFAKSKRCRYN